MVKHILTFILVITFIHQSQAGEKEDYYSIVKSYEQGFYSLTAKAVDGFLKRYPQSQYRDQVLLLQAISFYNTGKYPQATDIFNVLKDSASPDIKYQSWFYLGKLYRNANEYYKAEKMFKYVWDNVEDEKLKALAGYELGDIYLERRDYSSAVKYWQQILSLKQLPQENRQTVLNNLIYIYLWKRDWNKAQDLISQYFDSQSPQYLYFQARLAVAKKNFEKAEKMADALIAKNYSEYWSQMAKLIQLWIQIEKEQFQNLDAIFSSFPQKLPPSIEEEYKYLQAYSLYKQKLYSFAVRYYQRFISRYKDSRFLDRVYLELVDCFYNLDKLQEAQRYAEEFLEKFPDSLWREEILYSLGWIYYKEGKVELAIQQFKEVGEKSYDPELKINALCLVGDLLSEIGDLDSAIQQYDYVLKNYPESIYAEYAQYQLAVDFYHKRDYDSAILALNNLVQNFPKSSLLDKVYYQLGLAYFKKGEYELALEEINYLLKKSPDSPLKDKALLYKAVILFNMGDYENASKLAQMQGNSVYAHFLLAQICIHKKEWTLAEQEYNFLKEHITDPQILPYLYLQIGELKFNLGDWEQALANFQNAVQLTKESDIREEAIYWQAWSYYKKGQARKAIECFGHLKNSSDFWEESRFYSASILKEEKDYQKAIELLQEVIKNGKKFNRLAALKLGDIYTEINETTKAVTTYKRLEKAPYDIISAEASFKIGEILESQGKYPEAILQYLKVVSMYQAQIPFVPKAKIRCARLLEKEGKLSDALKIYQELAEGEGEEAIYAREKVKELKTGR